MAESIVSSALEKLGNLLIQEAFLLYGVRDQVKWVKKELLWIQSFLEDADAKRRKEEGELVKHWVREVVDVSYRVEDVIDTFMLRVDRRRRLRGILGSIKRYALIPSELIASHKINVEIESIKTEIRDINERRDTYGIAKLGETVLGVDKSLQTLRRIRPDISGDMDAIVGFDDYRKTVVSQLLDADMKHRCVISIVGMGGIGKTTLAKKVYNSPEISINFPTRVCLTVSSDFKPRDLVKSIASKVMSISRGELETMEEDEAEKMLCDFLKERRYLIVMDDIWTTDVWSMISAVLPDVKNGSRVLFTTRNENVSKSAGPNTNLFKLPVLNKDESWKLFSKKMFPTTCFPKELEEMGRRMAERCGGLPLALLVLGGILLTKDPTPQEWMQMEESMDWGATHDGERCMQVLALSYRNLPHHYLKSCFLYVASFPEDSKISASRLIRLWIAEGFIPQKGKEEMEDTARGYLNELVQRSMIQVVSSNYEGVLQCRIHDLVREMGIAEATQDRFFSIIHESITSFDQIISSSRRLVLGNLDVCSRGHLPSNTRSLLVPPNLDSNRGSNRRSLDSNCGSRIFQGLKLLRVLDIYNIKVFTSFPKEIKFMTHLRFLNLGYFRDLLKIPSSIGELSNLQTLDLEGCLGISELPKELGELPNLRHLLLPRLTWERTGTRSIHPSCPPFTTTTNLQTLEGISCEQQWMDESLPRLTSLRRLRIHTLGTVLFHSLRKLTRLAELSISSDNVPVSSDNVPVENIVTMLSNNDHLQELFLWGKWETPLPDINRFPRNLTKLIFRDSKAEDDPMPILEKLPNLVSLTLAESSYKGVEMVCTADGFPRLERLIILGLEKFENWIVEAGAFPKLRHLQIVWCPMFTVLPDGLQHVTSLRHLDLDEMFRDRLRIDVGEDWHKIKHVVVFQFFFK